jgi:transcriptional regulator of acetoin/glycerol metabolism
MAKPSHPELTYGLLAGDVAAKAKVINALRAYNGNATHAAAHLGVPARTLLRWLAKWPELQRGRRIGWSGG